MEKFQYLILCLRGEPANLVQNVGLFVYVTPSFKTLFFWNGQSTIPTFKKLSKFLKSYCHVRTPLLIKLCIKIIAILWQINSTKPKKVSTPIKLNLVYSTRGSLFEPLQTFYRKISQRMLQFLKSKLPFLILDCFLMILVDRRARSWHFTPFQLLCLNLRIAAQFHFVYGPRGI